MTIYYHPKAITPFDARNMVTLYERTPELVTFYPHGGGFQHSTTPEQFDRLFRPVSDAEMNRPQERGWFELDDTRPFQGFWNGCRWNGWAVPGFTRDVVNDILCELGDDTYWLEERDDRLYLHNKYDDAQGENPLDMGSLDGDLFYFDGWCWFESDREEVAA